MRKIHFILLSATVALFIQPVFADTDISSDNDTKPCNEIAKACLDAGYTRTADTNKPFWQGCMKPILLGQQVEGVQIDEKVVKNCRADKIKQLKMELIEFQKAFSTH